MRGASRCARALHPRGRRAGTNDTGTTCRWGRRFLLVGVMGALPAPEGAEHGIFQGFAGERGRGGAEQLLEPVRLLLLIEAGVGEDGMAQVVDAIRHHPEYL